MPETIRKATLEMLRPNAIDRSPQTNRELVYLIRDYFGHDGIHAYQLLRKDGELSGSRAQGINTYVFTRIGEFFGVRDREHCRRLYMHQQRDARGAVDQLMDFLPEYRMLIDLKNELRITSHSPADLLRLLALPPSKVDRVFAFQIHRHGILTYVAAQHNAELDESKLNTVLARLYRHLSRELFEGRIGEGQMITVNSVHDNETNEVIGLLTDDQSIPLTAHRKAITLMVRRVKGIGLVFANPRKKNDCTVIIKSLAMAHHDEGGVIDPNSILDKGGMEFVPIDSNVSPEELAERVLAAIETGPYNIEEITEANSVGYIRGQSSKIKFVRRRVSFRGIPSGFEFRVCSLEDYLNSLLEVGGKDVSSGLYDGRAHQLYQSRRIGPVLRDIFQREIYPQDLESALVRRSELTAQELRGSYRVT